ncbi:hypothetical protein ABZ897_16360 [Nonomuraea sp. NPDC046802]|uniref:hypothetical protein n=1 Tax=Nonomuraea sp. NPDC046802 TaxID=3154919 RepID=UPI0034043342
MPTTTTEKPIKLIIVNGFTGNEPEPDDNTSYLIWRVVRFHNASVPQAQAEEQTWKTYTAAEAAAEQAWQALDTTSTSEWVAAHHRWVKAEHELDTAAHAWECASRAMEDAWMSCNWGDRTIEVYEQVIREVGVRELIGAGRNKSSFSLASDLRSRRREREQLAGKTINRLPT